MSNTVFSSRRVFTTLASAGLAALFPDPEVNPPSADDGSTDFCWVDAPLLDNTTHAVECFMLVEPSSAGVTGSTASVDVWAMDQIDAKRVAWVPYQMGIALSTLGSPFSFKVAPQMRLYFRFTGVSAPPPKSVRVAFRPSAGDAAASVASSLSSLTAGLAALKNYKGAVAVTPNDGANLAVVPALALKIGIGGTVKVDTYAADGVTPSLAVPFTVSSGELLPFPVTKVYATGTTATGIVAGY